MELINIESRFLPKIALALPLQITSAIFVGKPSDVYPYPFSGYLFIKGSPAFESDWEPENFRINTGLIASFLKTLHTIPIDSETRSQAPGDRIGRTNLKRRAAKIEERLWKHQAKLAEIDIERLLKLVSYLSKTPPNQNPTCWVHGDLYPAHLMINESGVLCGVIDWGDMHLGDIALDLSIVFSFLPVSAHEEFKKSYGEIDVNCWSRARFTAIHYGAVLLDYGIDIKKCELVEMAKRALMSGLDGSE